jgi:serine phosphatase RsbU (regulator of sigma subunit)
MKAEAAAGEGIDAFFACYEARLQQLRYVHGGYPTPFVLRRTKEGASVLRLNAGADGVEEGVLEGQFGLLPGDVILAASESVMQLKNAEGEAWGEGSMIETVLSWGGHRAQDVAELTLRTAQEYAAGEEHQKDQVLLVMRVVAQPTKLLRERG